MHESNLLWCSKIEDFRYFSLCHGDVRKFRKPFANTIEKLLTVFRHGMVRHAGIVIEEVIEIIVTFGVILEIYGVADDSNCCSLVASALNKITLQAQSIPHSPQDSGHAP